MGLRERIKTTVDAALAFVEAMELGSAGYVEHRLETLERRVIDIEDSVRRKEASSSAERPASTPEFVG